MRWTFVGIAALAVLGACSGSTETGGLGGSGPGSGSCAQLAQAICDKLDSCLGILVQAGYGDVATCAARQKLECDANLAAPGTSMSTDALGACVSAIGAVACEDLLAGAAPQACQPKPGALADGAACGDDAQCASTSCKTVGGGSCGTCAARVAIGGNCANGADCAFGSQCDGSTCVVPARLGEACNVGSGTPKPCVFGLECKAGTCAKLPGLGETCSMTAGCDLFAGVFCDPTTNLCKEVGFAGAGETCGLVGGKFVACEAGGDCKVAQGMTTGTCAAPANDGEACGGTGEIACFAPADCVANVCKLPDPASCS